jgi:hypothetical protein
MSAEEVDLQPTTPEVLQSEEAPEGDYPIVAVSLVKSSVPVRTQELPHKGGATFTNGAVTTTPIRILRADKRRALATLMSIGGNMRIAFNNASAQDPSRMQLWPQNVAYYVGHDTDVYVAADTVNTAVSVSTELWATGEGPQ